VPLLQIECGHFSELVGRLTHCIPRLHRGLLEGESRIKQIPHLPHVLPDSFCTFPLVEVDSRLQVLSRILLKDESTIPSHEISLIYSASNLLHEVKASTATSGSSWLGKIRQRIPMRIHRM
jgi:hypothetical protein